LGKQNGKGITKYYDGAFIKANLNKVKLMVRE
jgi:hypothetical protein